MKEYIDEIKASLLKVADDKTKEKAVRLTSGAKCIGITVPQIRLLVKSFKLKYSKLNFEDVCVIINNLCKDKYREELLFGIFLISGYKKNITSIPWSKINSWLNAIDNWETCDQLSSNIAVPVIVSNISLTDKLIFLSQSSNLWKRRFAAATAANINYGGRQFPEQTLAICKILLSDKEPMVSKAVGWALKDLSKKSPDIVFNFLKANKENISERLLKESSEKLNKNQLKELKI